MDSLSRFLEYAGAFEQTYEDDDWTRITPYFASDAVYSVESKAFGCVIVGAEAIAAGIRKSVNGFDRRFDEREIEVLGSPEVAVDEVRLAWNVHYRKEGVEPYVLRGRTTVRFRDGLIVAMTDHYDATADAAFAEWQSNNELSIDPSYT
jgi:hypothetical protein